MFFSFSAHHLKKRIVPLTALALITTMTVPAVADGVRVYHISDGERTENITLFREDVQAAVRNSSFEEDEYDIQSVASTNEEYFVVSLKEKYDVTVQADGETVTVHTGDDTVEAIVAKAGIELDDDDETEPARDETVTEETEISVIRVTKVTEETTQKIKYKTKTVETDELYRGETKVKRKGKNGVVRKTYEIIYRDGEESERNLIDKEVEKKAVSKIVLKGTKQPEVQTSSGEAVAYSNCLTVEATAYSGGGLTASGTSARVGAIAVDPSVIPLGSRLYITSADGSSWVYGYAVAEDTGGAIKGNRIDLYFNSESQCMSFGRQMAKVYILS